MTPRRLAKTLRTAITMLYVHGLLSEAEYMRALGRFAKAHTRGTPDKRPTRRARAR